MLKTHLGKDKKKTQSKLLSFILIILSHKLSQFDCREHSIVMQHLRVTFQ